MRCRIISLFSSFEKETYLSRKAEAFENTKMVEQGTDLKTCI